MTRRGGGAGDRRFLPLGREGLAAIANDAAAQALQAALAPHRLEVIIVGDYAESGKVRCCASAGTRAAPGLVFLAVSSRVASLGPRRVSYSSCLCAGAGRARDALPRHAD